MSNNSRYFLTVDWCNIGQRGIFCNKNGNAFAKDVEPHTEDEIWNILDAFSLILNPTSVPLTEEEVKGYNRFVSLAEYRHEYGIAVKGGSNA